jgi:hypothetical protein
LTFVLVLFVASSLAKYLANASIPEKLRTTMFLKMMQHIKHTPPHSSFMPTKAYLRSLLPFPLDLENWVWECKNGLTPVYAAEFDPSGNYCAFLNRNIIRLWQFISHPIEISALSCGNQSIDIKQACLAWSSDSCYLSLAALSDNLCTLFTWSMQNQNSITPEWTRT